MRELFRKYSPIVLLTLWVALSFFVTMPWEPVPAADDEPQFHKVLLLSPPVYKPRTYAYEGVLLDSTGPFRLPERITLYLPKDSVALCSPGDVLLAYTAITEHRGFVRWGDWGRLEHRALSQISILQGKWRIPALLCRDRLEQVLHEYHLPANQEALIESLTLGDRRALTIDQREAFADAGAMHVLAVSGLHVGLLRDMVLFILTLGGLLTIPRSRPSLLRLQRVAVLLVIWAYAFITGLSVSVLRSVIMFTLLPLQSFSDNRPVRFNRLAVAALLILIVSPRALSSAGFVLSFSAVAALMYYMPRWERWQPRHGRYLTSLVLASLAAQIGTLPWTLLFFGQASNYFLLTNLIVIPLATLLLGAVLLTLPLACLLGSSPVVSLGVHVCGRLADWLDKSVGWVQSLPGATSVYDLPTSVPVLLALLIVSLSAVVHYSMPSSVHKKRKAVALLLSLLLAVLMALAYALHLK